MGRVKKGKSEYFINFVCVIKGGSKINLPTKQGLLFTVTFIPTLIPSPFGARPCSGHIKPENVRFELRDPDLVYAMSMEYLSYLEII
jgi:hypothetical protein